MGRRVDVATTDLIAQLQLPAIARGLTAATTEAERRAAYTVTGAAIAILATIRRSLATGTPLTLESLTATDPAAAVHRPAWYPAGAFTAARRLPVTALAAGHLVAEPGTGRWAIVTCRTTCTVPGHCPRCTVVGLDRTGGAHRHGAHCAATGLHVHPSTELSARQPIRGGIR